MNSFECVHGKKKKKVLEATERHARFSQADVDLND